MLAFRAYYLDGLLIAAIVIALVARFAFPAFSLGTALVMGAAVLATIPVIFAAVRSLRAREWASMDLLASVALGFSLAAGEFASAAFIGLMLASARILGTLNASRAEAGIRELLKLRPQTARIEKDARIETVPASSVRVGDVVVVGIGDRIPVDGEVLSGNAAVDESSLTGESLPVDKSAGSFAVSSTVVVSGSMRIRTERTGKDTTFERIIELVAAARSEKPKSETLGELFGKTYLIAVIAGSGLMYLVTHNLELVLAVVLVVCADDVAVAIPLAYLRGIGLAAREGAIIKGGRHLESLSKLRTVVFDKTGTLTKGTLTVAGVFPAEGTSEDALLRLAARAAGHSAHPLSRAIIARSGDTARAAPANWEEFGGKGVMVSDGASEVLLGKRELFEGRGVSIPPEVLRKADEEADKGRSTSFVAENGAVRGVISASDELKEGAAAVIAAVKRSGVARVVMLTGDNERVAQTIAREIGIDEVYARLLPEDKVSIIKRLQEKGGVIMVGDGVNDAAALSIAEVGIAMGGVGAQSTIESAQIILMRDDLSLLPRILGLSRTVRRVSVEDFYIWGATNAVGLVLVFAGVIGPAGAAAYNFISDFFPLMNTFRVRMPDQKAV